ncbi:MAG: EpsI family protein, partial [Candidatus Brocadiia bacterium]
MDESPTAGSAGPGRRRVVLIGAALLLVGIAFWWTFRWMMIRWDQAGGYYSHGWLVLPISAYLLYRRRKRIAACPVRACPWGLAVLVPALLVHVVASAWQVGFLSGFALLGALAGVVLTLLGPQMLRVVAFPLIFLLFMVPVPSVLIEKASFRLKLAAARLAVGFLDVAGLAAVREGSYVRIPTGTVVVDDVCSGLKYLIALTAFGALYAHISPLDRPRKALLFALSIPVAFVANVVRVILMLLVAYRWGPESVEQWYFHDLFGFALFTTAFLLLFTVESAFLKKVGLDRWGPEQKEYAAGPSPGPRGQSVGASGAVVVCLLALTAGAALYLSWPRQTAEATAVLARVPRRLGEWEGMDQTLDERVYEILGTEDVLSRVYVNDQGQQVQMLVVLARQVRRRTHPPEQCLTGEGFRITAARDRPVDLGGGGGPGRVGVRELALD